MHACRKCHLFHSTLWASFVPFASCSWSISGHCFNFLSAGAWIQLLFRCLVYLLQTNFQNNSALLSIVDDKGNAANRAGGGAIFIYSNSDVVMVSLPPGFYTFEYVSQVKWNTPYEGRDVEEAAWGVHGQAMRHRYHTPCILVHFWVVYIIHLLCMCVSFFASN